MFFVVEGEGEVRFGSNRFPIKSGDGWEYQRTCTEGPVFDARQIVWEASK